MGKKSQTKVAVVGMAYRLPGGSGAEFWRRLSGGDDLVSEVEEGRWSKEAYLHPRKTEPGSAYTFAAGSVAGATWFDPGFFGISPREAVQMDPQQRLLMELAWESLEDAGVRAAEVAGSRCGVYVGISSFDYAHRLADDLDAVDSKTPTGNAGSIAANRISYFLDAKGPSMVIDTACSSALVAFHQACVSVLSGESSMALAGGVSLHFHPLGFITFSKTGMLSRNGRCRTFDADADGYVRSEGGGIFVLKRLEDALAAGDRILGVVEGSGVNCDGRTPGITVPGHEAQAALLRDVYGRAGIDGGKLDYLEAHGTGTAVGDPIETWAIGEVLGKGRKGGDALPIGSVKSNLGHLEAASAVAGLVKVLLMFRHRVIPPNLHFDTPNPRIDFGELNLRVVDRAEKLPAKRNLLAGVNSFGFGGANAHVVLSSGSAVAAGDREELPAGEVPLVFSAKSKGALRDLAAALADCVELHGDHRLPDVARALFEKRDLLPMRALVRGKTAEEVAGRLRLLADGKDGEAVVATALPATGQPVFVFSGNGGQWEGMGRLLYAESEVFRQAVGEVDDLFGRLAPFRLLPHFQGETLAGGVGATEVAQPLVFAIQVGLVRLLEEVGIRPAAVIGHSLGEVAAAWAAGMLPLDEAVRVIRLRSLHQAATAGTGGMTAVAASRVDVEGVISEGSHRVEISGENGPASVTVAGALDALAAFEQDLAARSMRSKRLDLDYPFHSASMDGPAQAFLDDIGALAGGSGGVPFFSTVSGKPEGGPLGGDYWASNIRKPVVFRQAVEAAAADGHKVFLEIGPHPVLCSQVLQTLQGLKIQGHASGVVSKEACAAADLEREALGLQLGGVTHDWAQRLAGGEGTVVELPTYPWQREEYFLQPTAEGGGMLHRYKDHPLLGYRLRGREHAWENHLDAVLLPWLQDHKVGGVVVFPAAAFLEMALAAGVSVRGRAPVQVEDFEIRAPMTLGERRSRTVRLEVEPDGRFHIKSRERLSEDPWQVHVVGKIAPAPMKAMPRLPVDCATAVERTLEAGAVYSAAEGIGLEYGPAFQTLEAVERCGPRLVGRLAPWQGDGAAWVLPPALCDGALHCLFALLEEESSTAYLPVRFGKVVAREQSAVPVRVEIAVRRHGPRSLLVDLFLVDATGRVCVAALGTRLRAARLAPKTSDLPRLLREVEVERPAPAGVSALSGAGDEVAGMVRRTMEAMVPGSRIENYVRNGDALLEALCSTFAREAFGGLADADGVVSLAVAHATGSVARGMEGYFKKLAAMLVEDGMAECIDGLDDAWRLAPGDDMPGSHEIWRALLADFPEAGERLTVAGRVGMRLRSILAGEATPEEMVPRSAKLSDGGYALRHSGVENGMQEVGCEVLRELVEGHCVTRILWIGGAQPAKDAFPAAWMERYPGLVTAVIPETSESLDVHSRLDAMPGIEVVVGAGGREFFQRLVSERGGFDVLFLAGRLSPAAIDAARCALLPGGMLMTPVAERGRFRDFVPLPPDGGLFFEEAEGVPEGFERTVVVPAVAGFDKGPGLAVSIDTPGGASKKEGAGLILVPLDGDAGPVCDTLAAEGGLAATAAVEVLPPSGGEAVDLWKRIIRVHGADGVVFVATTSGDLLPAEDRALEICGIATCLRVLAEMRGAPASVQVVLVDEHGERPGASWSMAALRGFLRVARNEFPQLRIRWIDAHGRVDGILADLASELRCPDSEDEVVLRQGGRAARRVVFDEAAASGPGSGERAVLDFDTPGPFQHLHWKREHLFEPHEAEVAIDVRAAGLNFRDVMYAMGLLPDEALEDGFAGQTLGMELAGVVSACGAGVETLKPGDEVIAFSPASFSTTAVTKASAVVRKPPGISFEAAATIPAAFFTAYHALCGLARLAPGERVLIHGAAGGVGIAAIQIARHLGAEIFATAGSPDKRDFVRLLGADHVFDSRSLDFADGVMEATRGEGVDVVLNSLAGEAVSRNLEILRPFGRLLELGKRDFYENNRIGLRPFRNNIRYFAVDADQLMALRPGDAEREFRELLELFRDGVLSPLPYTVFKASEAADAFRFMQHSSQTGKVVISTDGLPAPRRGLWKGRLDAGGVHLVTGGLRGFGLQTAKRLVERGAGKLVLLGRTGAMEQEGLDFVAECRAKGVEVRVEACDIADERAVAALLASVRAEWGPLRGVFHAAMVLRDAMIMNLDPAQVAEVMRPKVDGADVLDRLTREDGLEFFVLYSSATTFFGNPGQAAYVAANTALEELALRRLEEGLPATCILWGPLGDAGYLARNEQLRDSLAARTGGQPLLVSDALDFLEGCLVQGGSHVAWVGMNWSSLARFLPSANSPRFRMLQRLAHSTQESSMASTDLRMELERMEPAELIDALKGILKEEISGILRVGPEKLDEHRSLLDVGMDSLMGVELMTSLESNLGVSIPLMALSEGPTIARLAEKLAYVIKQPAEQLDGAGSTDDEQLLALAAQHGVDGTEFEEARANATVVVQPV